MDTTEAQGSSIDDAIANALRTLGTTRDRVEIEIISDAARGLFGIGSRKAKVRATLRPPVDAAAPARSPAPRPAPAAPTPLAPIPAGSSARASQLLQELIDRVGVPARVSAKEEDGRIVLDIDGDTSGILIGRRGQMLDALEYVINRMVGRDEGGPTRIIVDSHEYRTRRRQGLEELARSMAEQAKRKHRVVTLNPMSPRDRRIIHLALQADDSLTTKSSGNGYLRKLVIIPAGARRGERDDG